MHRLWRSLIMVALVSISSGCAPSLRHPRIADLQHNPGRYQDRSVNIDGVVTSSWGVPLVPFRLYKVDDGTGEVTVFAQGSRTPTKGARVHVRGRVGELAVVGGQPIGLHLQEEKLDIRRW